MPLMTLAPKYARALACELAMECGGDAGLMAAEAGALRGAACGAPAWRAARWSAAADALQDLADADSRKARRHAVAQLIGGPRVRAAM